MVRQQEMEENIPTIDDGTNGIAAHNFYQCQRFWEELQEQDHMDIEIPDLFDIPSQNEPHLENPEGMHLNLTEGLSTLHIDNFQVKLVSTSDGGQTHDAMMSMGNTPQHFFDDSERITDAVPNTFVRSQHLSYQPIGLMAPLQLSDSMNKTSQLFLQGSVGPSIQNPFENSPFNFKLLASSMYLPAPPEVDPQVMLDKAPEKGKFLEAVKTASLVLSDYVEGKRKLIMKS